MFDADTQLLQPRQIVEHAPLLNNAAIGDPENGNFLYLNTPPRRFNAPERTLMRSSGNVTGCDFIARAENIYYLFMPVRERRSDPGDAETYTLDAASFWDFRTHLPMRQELTRIYAFNQSEVAGVPNLMKCFSKVNVVHS